MIIYQLKIKLLSDTTFGRGDGVAGLIDQEVEHDIYGFPYLRGRTLKGLLREECDNLIAILPEQNNPKYWENIACSLFGISGSQSEMAVVHIGDAFLPDDLRRVVAYEIESERLNDKEVISSLTNIRRQTAINSENGVADEGSLRSFRVIMRELEFTANLSFETQPTEEILSLLSVGILALRRLGSGRNRGRGHVKCTLHQYSEEDITKRDINLFGNNRETVI